MSERDELSAAFSNRDEFCQSLLDELQILRSAIEQAIPYIGIPDLAAHMRNAIKRADERRQQYEKQQPSPTIDAPIDEGWLRELGGPVFKIAEMWSVEVIVTELRAVVCLRFRDDQWLDEASMALTHITTRRQLLDLLRALGVRE
jgi:hypothetical protein